MGARVRPHDHVRVIHLVVLLLVCIGLLWNPPSVLAQGSPSPSASTANTVLRIGWPHEPDSLNPFAAGVVSSWEVLNLNYDVLVGIDPDTMAPQKGESAAGLATDWSASADGKSWTFVLRHDAAWQDGSGPVTAHDVAFTYNLIIDNALAQFAPLTTDIRNVTAVDDYTVRFDCTRPKADTLYNANLIWILPEHIWKKVPVKSLETGFTNKPPIVGSGAFQTVTFKKGSHVELNSNPDYWRGSPKADGILFEYYTNSDTMALDMKSGTLDACSGLQHQQLRMFDGVQGITAQAIPANVYDDLVFNCYEPPAGATSLGNPVLRDWRFRQALQWAVDRQKVVDLAYAGNSRPGDTVVVPGFSKDPDWHWTAPADQAYRFDLAKAAQLLESAGYTDTDGDGIREADGKPIKLRLAGRTENQGSQTEAKLIAGWFRQIGLDIDLETLESGALADRIYSTANGKPAPDFDMFIWGWYNALDPGGPLANFLTSQIGGLSDSFYSNPTFDRLWSEQSRTLDTAKRKQLVDRLQELIYQQTPYVVLTYPDDVEAWNTAKWTGWTRMPTGAGNVIIPYTGNANFLNVQPKVATGTETGREGGDLRWAAVGIVAAVIAVAAIILIRRRKTRAVEE